MEFDYPHRRYNPLTREWVLVSPHRARRPWLGQEEKTPAEEIPAYDPDCYLCPGNARAGGVRNPTYTGTFVFDNDFPALIPPGGEGSAPNETIPKSSLFAVQPEQGLCRVACFSARHDLSLPELPLEQVEQVVRMWSAQTQELADLEYIRYVQVFENKGEVMGCSNPHPHNQIWATRHIPNEPSKELRAQSEYHDWHKACLLCDYLSTEVKREERLVCSNDHFTALVPFWANWPFEILLISHRHVASLPELDETEVRALADVLRRVTTRYDNLFEIAFPYSMGFHQSPSKGGPYPGWHLHAHYYPPLLRSATVKKFMVGYEMLAMPQRDITAELAAERLRSMSETHYKAV